jgi:hypothetical protein
MKAVRELMGAGAPTRIELGGIDDEGGASSRAETVVTDALRFIELTDALSRSHIGGDPPVIDPDAIEEEPTEITSGTGRGPGSEPPGDMPAIAAVASDTSPATSPDDDPCSPPVTGHWVSGHFIPLADALIAS